MVQGWVTMLVLAFGILVAVIGVIAYLRMFRKDRLDSIPKTTPAVSPPSPIYPVIPKDGVKGPEVISEQAVRRE